jgi:hypothetical protein
MSIFDNGYLIFKSITSRRSFLSFHAGVLADNLYSRLVEYIDPDESSFGFRSLRPDNLCVSLRLTLRRVESALWGKITGSELSIIY